MLVQTKEHIRYILLKEFHKGVNTNTAAEPVLNIYGMIH